ncbi:hypothetical protein niasHT_008556 [Heterodera trifolii]|uniref:Uncharacterized protein n=1 Tax=Heterodera trifolii TaxID=157864 RepID=A0ABD2MA24_9BILA
MKRKFLSAVFLLLFVLLYFHQTLAGGCPSSISFNKIKKKKKQQSSTAECEEETVQAPRNRANAEHGNVSDIGTGPAGNAGMASTSAGTRLNEGKSPPRKTEGSNLSSSSIDRRLAKLEQMLGQFITMPRPRATPTLPSNLMNRRFEKRISNLETQVTDWISKFEGQSSEDHWPQIEWEGSDQQDGLPLSSADFHPSSPATDQKAMLARKRSLSAGDIAAIKAQLMKFEFDHKQQQQRSTSFDQRGETSSSAAERISANAAKEHKIARAEVAKGKRPMIEEEMEGQQLPYEEDLPYAVVEQPKTMGQLIAEEGTEAAMANGKKPLVQHKVGQSLPYEGEAKNTVAQLLQHEREKTVAQLIAEAEQRTVRRPNKSTYGHSGELIKRFQFQQRRGRPSSRASSTPPSLTREQSTAMAAEAKSQSEIEGQSPARRARRKEFGNE